MNGNASKIAFGSVRQGDTVQNNWRFVEDVLYRDRAIEVKWIGTILKTVALLNG